MTSLEPNPATGIGNTPADIDSVGQSVAASLKDIRKTYYMGALAVEVLHGISLDFYEGEYVSIMGPSGCGKSTFAKVLMGLETATAGHLLLDGRDIGTTAIEDRGTQTVADIQMVFQNPFDTLNPSMTVGRQIIRALEVFGVGTSARDRKARMRELLDLVKLPREFASRMPRQLSGGQKQRVGIARAFAGDARIVVADEPVSALDVSVQAQIINLLLSLKKELGLTMVFVSHNLAVVEHLADYYIEAYTMKNFGYNMLTVLEESLEMIGVVLFIRALLLSFVKDDQVGIRLGIN